MNARPLHPPLVLANLGKRFFLSDRNPAAIVLPHQQFALCVISTTVKTGGHHNESLM